MAGDNNADTPQKETLTDLALDVLRFEIAEFFGVPKSTSPESPDGKIPPFATIGLGRHYAYQLCNLELHDESSAAPCPVVQNKK